MHQLERRLGVLEEAAAAEQRQVEFRARRRAAILAAIRAMPPEEARRELTNLKTPPFRASPKFRAAIAEQMQKLENTSHE